MLFRSTDFDVGDIDVTNGTLENFQVVAGSNNRVYTARFRPTDNFRGTGTVTIQAGKLSDSAGKINPRAALLNPITISTV